MIIPEKMNERIRFLRMQHGYTQQEIINILGVGKSVYSMYESGERTISVEIVTKLAKLYNVSTDFIIGLTNNTKSGKSSVELYLTDEAARAIVRLGCSRDKNALAALNTLLSDRWCYKIFCLLGLLLKYPNNFNKLIMEDIDDSLRRYMLSTYKKDFAEILNIPNGMFGIEKETLSRLLGVYTPDVIETHFNIYLNRFINKIRESPETKKAFLDELKRIYYKEVKKDIEEAEESIEEILTRSEKILARSTEAQEFDNETE